MSVTRIITTYIATHYNVTTTITSATIFPSSANVSIVAMILDQRRRRLASSFFGQTQNRRSVVYLRFPLLGRRTLFAVRRTLFARRRTLMTGQRITLTTWQSALYGRRISLRGRGRTLSGRRSALYGRRSPLYGRRCLLYGRPSMLYGRRGLLDGRRREWGFDLGRGL